MVQRLTERDFEFHLGYLGRAAQTSILADIRDVVKQAPMIQPMTPQRQKMSVRMTSAGRLGWIADPDGYRYDRRQPSGKTWPDIPRSILKIWRAVSGVTRDPDCCLINFYGEGARLGMHQDKDEGSFDWPVVSISLGDEALFRMGDVTRGGKTSSVWLKSGDVVVMGGAARLKYHGVDRIKFGSSPLLKKGGRINLTLRVAG